mgnify:FL=1
MQLLMEGMEMDWNYLNKLVTFFKSQIKCQDLWMILQMLLKLSMGFDMIIRATMLEQLNKEMAATLG